MLKVIDKVTFALKEMLLARKLLEFQGSGFYHRALARTIIIRLPDFITFARRLNNLYFQGAKKEQIKGELNALSSLYDQYLMEIRHSYGGHFKDQDFADRIAVWSKIDLVKVDFFTGEALKIYALFSDVPEYLNFLNGIPLLDETDSIKIQELIESQLLEQKPMLSSDILSITRFNSGGIIPTNDLQDRVAAMQSLTILLDFEFNLLGVVNQEDLVRLIKSLILVDIVNFSDNFFTRILPTGAKQEMDGLDEIVLRSSLKSAPIIFNRIKQSTKVKERVEQIRNVRNKIGAHIDNLEPLTTILLGLDQTTNDEMRSLYGFMKNLFQNICNSERSLQAISLPPTVLSGVISVGNQPLQPFNEGQIPPIEFLPVEYNEENFKKVWDDYLKGEKKGEAVNFFRDAMYTLEEKAVARLEENLGPHSVRYHQLKLNDAHFFFQKLMKEYKTDSARMVILLELLMEIKDASIPFLLCELYPSINEIPELEDMVAVALGETSGMKDQQSISILMERFRSSDVDYLITSLLALLKIDVYNTGIRAINRVGKVEETRISSFILEKIETLSGLQQIILSITLLSELYFNRRLGTYQRYWAQVYEQPFRNCFKSKLQDKLIEWDVCLEGQNEQAFIGAIQSFNKNHFGWAAKLIGDLLRKQQPGEAQILYHLAAYQIRIPSMNKELLLERAYSLCVIGDYLEALRIAEYLCESEAFNPYYRIVYLDIAAADKNKNKFNEMAQKTLSELILTPKELKIIEQLEQGLDSCNSEQ